MIYGYARVSTAAQDETGQVRQLKAAGCEKVFREKITGTTADRPQLRALMKKLAPGDVVITPAVDRLSRDTTDLLVIARDMQRAGAGIRSLAEPFLDTTSDFAEIIFAILGVAAKLERRRILERTARGRADAKEKGVKFGRKPILTPTSRKRPANASMPARRSAALPAATMSVKARFADCRKRAREEMPPRDDPIRLLYLLYFVPCEVMYQHHQRLTPYFFSGNPETTEAARQEFFAFSHFWFASLFVVVEGWKELKILDVDITPLIETHIDSLRLFRNAVYHFQRGDKKHAQFFDVDKFNWAENIHDALRRYFAAKGWYHG